MIVQNQAKFNSKATPSIAQEMTCPAFSSLLEIMNGDHKWTILDLGPARSSNLENLANFRCKIFIEDTQALLRNFTGDEITNEELLAGWLRNLSKYIKPASVDVILAWDVLNYLDGNLLALFLKHITPLLTPTAYIHCLIYSQHEMPSQPTQFAVIADGKMKYRAITDATRPSPGFTQKDITQRLVDFNIMKSFLLRNGIQEYLLRRALQ